MGNSVFIRADEIAQELDISRAMAYRLVHDWNEELKAQGYCTVAGRVSRQYYHEKMYGMSQPAGERREYAGV